jgi:Tfp pilus assembly protein PilF
MSPPPEAYAAAQKPGLGDSITSSIKDGLGKLGEAVTPKPRVKPADDPVSLATEAHPGVGLHVAVARLYEESGKLAEATNHYQEALRREPNSLPALLGYAHLKDRSAEPAEARKLYLQAVRTHPNEASAHNNLALFYAGRGMLNESSAAMTRAIQLQPTNPKYRNNIAQLLVTMGRTTEAFAHLSAVHRPAVAHYNLGYLLERQGQWQAAAEHFAIALRTDSSLAAARRGLERLQRPAARPQLPNTPAELGTRVSSRPLRPTGKVPLPGSLDAGQRPPAGQFAPTWDAGREAADPQPAEAAPLPPSLMRLPPTSGEPPVPLGPAPLPPDSSGRQPTPAASIPPRAQQSPALQHLPRVN